MTYELVPRAPDPVTVIPRSTWRTGIAREAKEVELRSAIQQLHEQARLSLAQVRIQNGLTLTARAVTGVAGLDALIGAVSADKPFLELELRQLQRIVGAGIGGVILNYLGGA